MTDWMTELHRDSQMTVRVECIPACVHEWMHACMNEWMHTWMNTCYWME